jgi:sugar/nucleoside kinase (ribokinase family)
MDVVGLGTFAMDVLKKVNALPKEDDFCIIEDTTYLPGGSGTNVIVQLARLGAKCGYIGKVAKDQVGKGILNSLTSENVDIDKMIVTSGGISLHTEIIIDHEGNKFIMLNMGDVATSLRIDETDLSYLTQAEVYYTDLFPKDPAIAGLKAARQSGKKTVFNMQTGLETMESLGITKEDILETLQYVDVFAPCRSGLYALAESTDVVECSEFLRKYCKGILLFTLGKKGAVAFDEQDAVYQVQSIEVNSVDTTGAGDSFIGGFIYSHLLQKESLNTAMEFATACAAYTCTGLGARFSPTLAQVKEFIKTHR